MGGENNNMSQQEKGTSGNIGKASRNLKGYLVSFAQIGSEKLLYIVVPNRGCTQSPQCLFCAFQITANPSLKIDRAFGREVVKRVHGFIQQYNPDFVVLYNSGNILRPSEMYQPAITEDIPLMIAQDHHCRGMEIEIRADDVARFKNSIQDIVKNLSGKILRVRLGIEFADRELLERHQKQITISDINAAVKVLNELQIPWNGYALLGGLDLGREEARRSTVKTGKYIIDHHAFKISINGLFLTEGLQRSLGQRIYIPDLDDLRFVLVELAAYVKQKGVRILFKVGFEEDFEEEAEEKIVRFPYVSEECGLRKVIAMLRKFNIRQDVKLLKVDS